MRSVLNLCLLALFVASCVAHTTLQLKQSSLYAALPNITAIYECNANCTEGCVPASIAQGTCVYVPPAKSWLIYTCENNNTEVHLKAFGPIEAMCQSWDPLHLSFTYLVDTCVLPKAGGYTRYHCPV